MIPVVWATWNGGRGKCCWDQNLIDDLLRQGEEADHRFGEGADPDPDELLAGAEAGAVVVIPARFQVEHVDRIRASLDRLAGAVVLLTSDEESTFPWHELEAPTRRIWIQSPRPDRHAGLDRFLPVGRPERGIVALEHAPADRGQPNDWFFAGQVNHGLRERAREAMGGIPGGSWLSSPGFTLGLDREEYLVQLSRARVAPCPSGPASADTFRTWEALEAGAVPIVDGGPIPDEAGRAVTGYPRGFWDLLAPDAPFGRVESWGPGETRAEIERILADWPASGNRALAWWLRRKRDLRTGILDDARDVMPRAGDPLGTHAAPGASVTVLVPTSPAPIHPSTEHLEETVGSVLERLPRAELLVMVDGIRPELEGRRAAYDEYVRRLLWLCAHRWGATPLLHDVHRHQAAMTREALELVRTEYVLYLEHDAPLVGDVPWERCLAALAAGEGHVVRLYPEAELQPAHAHLHHGRVGPFVRTSQWSQRPHLARTDFYRRILREHFSEDPRTMIEDVMHGVVQDAPSAFRILIYAPEGSIQRSRHLDSRGEDPKFEGTFVR